MQPQFTANSGIGSNGFAVIPKFRLSYNSSRINSKNQQYGFSRLSAYLTESERLPRKADLPLRSQYTKINNKPVYQCKQNVSPIILELKNLETNMKNPSNLFKRPVSSYQIGFFNSKQEILSPVALPQASKVIPFRKNRANMDEVCLKMAESIILSSDTLDSISEMSAPLSYDSFEKIRFLGQGKFGQVHLVKHKQTGFICALKIISKKVVRQEKVQGQIAKQLRIHSQLKCLNIIDFYGFFDDEQSFYILLEFATENSVFSKLKGKSRLQQQEIQPIAKGLCDGLKFIHRMGFVHRDIKPQNIVMQFGVPKICDFGWATDCDDIHLCKSYCGTPLYISPEMVRKQFYGTSVDIWAAGLVVYELLVGRVPFSIWSENDMNQILVKSIEFPEYIDRTENCQGFIRKCLQKQTYNRMEVSEALRHPFLHQQKKGNLDYQFYEMANQVLNNY